MLPPAGLVGVYYARSIGEFAGWFSTDADCRDYLEWLRWPQGDGWKPYRPATRELHVHGRLPSAAGPLASELLPGVHTVSSPKRWLLGTHQGRSRRPTCRVGQRVRVPLEPRPIAQPRTVFYRVVELAAAHDPVRSRDPLVNPAAQRQAARTAGNSQTSRQHGAIRASRPWRASWPLRPTRLDGGLSGWAKGAIRWRPRCHAPMAGSPSLSSQQSDEEAMLFETRTGLPA